MGRPDCIFGQFRETMRCLDAQHGDGVCCAFTSQLVLCMCLVTQGEFTRVFRSSWERDSSTVDAVVKYLKKDCDIPQQVGLTHDFIVHVIAESNDDEMSKNRLV